MPNHVHVIIIIQNAAVGFQNFEPLRTNQNQFQKIIPRSLGAIVRGFKIGVTKLARQKTNNHEVWQRNFYEHIIRDEKDLVRIREYIKCNPFTWLDDRNYMVAKP
jgi:putative transposase